MMKKLFLLLGLMSLFIDLSALSLKESIVEVLNNNPVVAERLKNYRETQQDLNIAESEYYPKIDLRSTVGYNKAGNIFDSTHQGYRDVEYHNYTNSLIISQNIFDGFGTMHKVDYQEARILAAAYNYVEKANDISFTMLDIYLSVIREYELLQTARENVEINKSIWAKVNNLFASGLNTESEVKKIESSLALAESNLIVQRNNVRETEYQFKKTLGRMPSIEEMQKPTLDINMPESLTRATLFAIQNNPSLLVSDYNIKSAQAMYKQNQKSFYPRIDIELEQRLNDSFDHDNGFDNPDDRSTARIVLNYNFFNGGADKATRQKNISTINKEVEIKRTLKREVIEGIELSWMAYEMGDLQLEALKTYSKHSERTLELYKEEYDLGRRSLLDLLSAQGDVINSREQIINAEHAKLFANYRILDAMGLLTLAVLDDPDEYKRKVNLYTNKDAEEILDNIPVKFDVDNDKIVDGIDICDNSIAVNGIMPYGCVLHVSDEDKDGIIDSKDSCSFTPVGISVGEDGCALDLDEDSIKDYQDECLDTPLTYTIDEKGCAVSSSISSGFKDKGLSMSLEQVASIEKLYKFLKRKPDYSANIISHTNVSKGDIDNKTLSAQRASLIKDILIKKGIAKDRLSDEGRANEEPIAEEDAEDAAAINSRIVVELNNAELEDL